MTTNKDKVTFVAFSTNSTILASTSCDATLRLWDAATGVQLQTLKFYDDREDYDREDYFVELIPAVIFSSNNKMVVSTFFEMVRLWDTETGARLQTLKCPNE